MASGDLKDIFIHSGVNERWKGFCTVTVNGGDLVGQLSPEEVRRLALDWLEAAEAAETDAIVGRILTSHGAPPEVAAEFLVDMRKRRSRGGDKL